MFDWGYLLKALAQITVVVIFVIVMAVLIVSAVRQLRKRDK